MALCIAVVLIALIGTACGIHEDRWEAGALYSIGLGDGTFGVAKVLALDPGIVSIRMYKQTFPQRPKAVDPATLTLGKVDDEDGFGIGHLPLEAREFAFWFPVFVSQGTVSEEELEGYRMWMESGAGAFGDSEEWAVIDEDTRADLAWDESGGGADAERGVSTGKEQVYFVPLGVFPDSLVWELVSHYKKKLDLEIQVLPVVDLRESVFDSRRRQLIAEELIELIERENRQVSSDRSVVLIGLTSKDMYVKKYSWRFAFGYRSGGRFAVISTARMDPVNLGDPVNDDLMRTRLRKMVTKEIAILYYGMQQTSDPNSVLYNKILGIEELDRIGEDL